MLIISLNLSCSIFHACTLEQINNFIFFFKHFCARNFFQIEGQRDQIIGKLYLRMSTLVRPFWPQLRDYVIVFTMNDMQSGSVVRIQCCLYHELGIINEPHLLNVHCVYIKYRGWSFIDLVKKPASLHLCSCVADPTCSKLFRNIVTRAPLLA